MYTKIIPVWVLGENLNRVIGRWKMAILQVH